MTSKPARLPRSACLVLVGVVGLVGPLSRVGAAETLPDRPNLPAAEVDVAIRPSDRAFLESASAAHHRGATLSRIVSDRSTHAEIRSLSQMLGTYHAETQTKLSELAQARKVTLPAPSQREAQDKNLPEDATALDQAYLEAVEENHKVLINLCEEAVPSMDADLGRFAQEQLPTLHDHLTQVRNLRTLQK